MRSCCSPLHLLCVSILLLSPLAAAQETPATAVGAQDTDAPPPLLPGQIARVGDVPITDAEYLHYLGTVYARQTEGEVAIQQELTERILVDAAAAARVSATAADVEDLAKRLDARSLAETGKSAGLLESLAAGESELRRPLELLALQELVIAAESGEQYPSDQQLRDWMDAHLVGLDVLPAPLDDDIAARWPGGELSREELGRRIHSMLEPKDSSGVLTELIGVLLIRDAAAQAGIVLTPEAIAEEITQRDALIRSRDATSGISYTDIVQQVQKLSVEELIATPRFRAEVLLRLLVEQRWTEAQLRQLFEADHAGFVERLGPDVTFETALPTVWREVRQRSYRQLFAESTIMRRF